MELFVTVASSSIFGTKQTLSSRHTVVLLCNSSWMKEKRCPLQKMCPEKLVSETCYQHWQTKLVNQAHFSVPSFVLLNNPVVTSLLCLWSAAIQMKEKASFLHGRLELVWMVQIAAQCFAVSNSASFLCFTATCYNKLKKPPGLFLMNTDLVSACP